MPKISIRISHELGKEAALARLKNFMDKIQEDFKDKISEMSGQWDDNVLTFAFTTYGLKIKGRLVVEEQEVLFDGEIPFAAVMFKGQIEKGIREELEKTLR